ncbi:MAG: dipicolinate synthase [Clostridia bacterium]|nr:dipicolinate synthase [Clostridia bacterium]
MEELPITIDGAKCLVCGFGRIGKLLSHKLHALGGHVTVAARKYSDFAWISAFGYTPHHISNLTECLDDVDVVFNTVPVRIFGRRELEKLHDRTLCIDLASKPGGFDLDMAGKTGVKVIWALSLPGKVAPVTAGRTIQETIVNILTENGILL